MRLLCIKSAGQTFNFMFGDFVSSGSGRSNRFLLSLGVLGFESTSVTSCLTPRSSFSIQMFVFDHENFQGRCIEINAECMNVCDMGMDKVRSLRVECGP